MNINQRRTEVRSHIDRLQEIANKHMANNKKRLFNQISENIERNKRLLKVLDEDLIKQNRITVSRNNHE